MAGQRFGRLLAIRITTDGPKGHINYLCACDCGTEKAIPGSHLARGSTKSCGCLQRERIQAGAHTTHGRCRTPEYRVWWNMVARCRYPCVRQYKDYGGRGITVCERWEKSFQAFLDDMGPRPSPKHSIERLNNHGNYEPGNCKWVERPEQDRNKRNNRLLTAQGETLTLAEWSRRTGLAARTISQRISRLGWTEAQAVNEPSSPYAKKR